MPIGYPPTYRNVDDVQPEVCDLCGVKVGAAHLMETDVEGLRGLYVCDVQPGCRKFRASLSYSDRRRMDPGPDGIGDSRIYPAGAPPWWPEDEDGNF